MSERESSGTYSSLLHALLEILDEQICMNIYYLFVSFVDGVLPYLAENLNE